MSGVISALQNTNRLGSSPKISRFLLRELGAVVVAVLRREVSHQWSSQLPSAPSWPHISEAVLHVYVDSVFLRPRTPLEMRQKCTSEGI